MIQLDGSHGEGGGSIFRQALALSILTGKDFIIKNIRQNRSPSGLAPQHLASLNAAALFCKATYWGNELGSSEVYFKPGKALVSQLKVDIGTAGSCTLMLQSLMLPAIFSGKKTSIFVSGGSDVAKAAPFDYLRNIFLPQLRKYADVDASLFRRGYYPKGGGQVKFTSGSNTSIDDFHIPILLNARPSKLLQIKGISHASADLQDARVSERQAESALLALKILNVPVNINSEYSSAESTGSGITLWAIFGEDEIDFNNPFIVASDCLGERGKKAENVGADAASELLRIIESGALDEHLGDQLIPILGLVGGIIKVPKITDHILSNIYVTEEFLGCKFEIEDDIIRCNKMAVRIDADA